MSNAGYLYKLVHEMHIIFRSNFNRCRGDADTLKLEIDTEVNSFCSS